MTECLFCRIAAGEIPADVVSETDQTISFRDVAPQSPTHVLVIPKKHFPDAAHLVAESPSTMVAIWTAVASVVEGESLAHGYRVVFNTGDDAGQTVHHVHAHVLGGRRLTWPPG